MKYFLATVLLICGSVVFGQESHDEHLHEQEGHDHFHDNELGVSFAPVYFSSTKEIAFGLHSHYVRRLGESRFGTGVGAEYIFNAEQHQTYSVVLQYSPLNSLHLVAAPGVAIEKHVDNAPATNPEKGSHGVVFALHLEAVYEFELGPMDIGPSVEFAYDPHDIHLSLGVHLAFPF